MNSSSHRFGEVGETLLLLIEKEGRGKCGAQNMGFMFGKKKKNL